MILYRAAKNTDKDQILDFCKSTFEWGDYIHEVWDIWIKEKDGLLMVAEIDDELSKNKKTIAMIHGIVYDDTVWIEGIRVNPQFRKKGVGKTLVNKILEYGKDRKAKRASALVSVKNNPSIELMNKLNFMPVDKWIYTSTNTINLKNFIFDNIKKVKIEDKKMIESFLPNSEKFSSQIIRFVKDWRWYTLTKEQLHDIILSGNLYIYFDNKIRGVVIIGIDTYFFKNNYEIVYLYGESKEIVANLINYCRVIAHYKNNNINNNNSFECDGLVNNDNINGDNKKKMNIFCPDSNINSEVLDNVQINNSSKFILYDKNL